MGINSNKVTTRVQCIHSEAASITHRFSNARFCNGRSGQSMKPTSARSWSRAVAEIIAQPDSGRPSRQT
jgi:hypothetical protein